MAESSKCDASVHTGFQKLLETTSNKFVSENEGRESTSNHYVSIDVPKSYEEFSNDNVFKELDTENEEKQQSASNKNVVNAPPLSSETVEMIPTIETIESFAEDEVVDALPLSCVLPDEGVEVPSRAIILHLATTPPPTPTQTQTRTRLRNSVIVDTDIKNYSGSEIFDPNELNRAVESVGELEVNMLLEGWVIETRERVTNGRIDKVYRHRNTSKIFRSLVEVKTFILSNALRQNNVHTNDDVDKPLQLGSMKRKRDEASSSCDTEEVEINSPENSRLKVEKFYDDALDTLLNLCNQSMKGRGVMGTPF